MNKYKPGKQLLKSQYKEFVFDGVPAINRFLPINYEITDSYVKFGDLENYLNDIDVTDQGHHIYFKWSFPIYVIEKDTLNTY